MTNEQMQQAAMGVVLVVLAYAVYQHFKKDNPAKAATAPISGATPGGGGDVAFVGDIIDSVLTSNYGGGGGGSVVRAPGALW